MAAPRPVRIPRAGSRPAAADDFRANSAGETRAIRLFVLFLVLLGAIFLTFVALAIASPSPGVRSNLDGWAALSIVALALVVGGWVITLGRTPRAVARRDSEVVVRERLGRLRHFALDDVGRARVAYRNPASFLGPEPTEVVEIVSREGGRRTYLLGEDLLESRDRPYG